MEVRGDLRCWKEIKEMSLKNGRLGITACHRFESPRFGLMFLSHQGFMAGWLRKFAYLSHVALIALGS